ncbi:uncharacterized protein LOC107607899 [Arachis ipaensis]|uniref:uncharacterized protein LOC107607899 n=1 Tax=Arachis ipaensis TaxID=130454 RepID=UPI0007AFA91E|nr:uncharacterized protein LOC107607899 [Arachis ipaensis]
MSELRLEWREAAGATLANGAADGGVSGSDARSAQYFHETFDEFIEFQDTIIQKLGLQGVKRVEKLFYRISISVLRDDVKYDSFVIGNDEDLEVLFPTAACSSSRFVGASSSLSVIKPEAVLVASPSFATDLNRTRDRERVDTGPVVDVAIAMAGIDDVLPESRQGRASDGVEDVFQDEDDDDVEPATITDDSDDKDARNTLAGGGGATSSGTPQYPPPPGTLFSFGLGCHETVGRTCLLQSDYRKYHGKCKYFSNSDHRRLDYHVISAFILPIIRADAAVSIKVLQNVTETHFGFRPTYRRVWMAKQKAVDQIYGDWEESYNELPRWVLGVQITMSGSVAVLSRAAT